MSDLLILLFYCVLFLVGLIIGFATSIRGYQKKAKDLIDFMYFNKRIEKEEYDYYIEKYVNKQDNIKNVFSFVKRRKEGKTQDE